MGRYAKLIDQAKQFQTAQFTNMVDVNVGVVAQLDAEADVQAIMGDAYLGVLAGSASPSASVAQQLARATVNRMVFRDNPQHNQTLTQENTIASLVEIIRQMKEQGATVLRMTVGSTVADFVGTGNAVVVASTKRDYDGLDNENLFAETVTITCTSDSYNGGAEAGNEGLLAQGPGSQGNVFAFDWPLGSNCSASFNVVDGNSDATNGNLLTNSGFDTWDGTDDFLSNWELITGTVGTNISEETAAVYDGDAAIRLTGDGATNVRWRQLFNSSAGTISEIDDLTQYAFTVFCRRDGVQAAAGVLRVSLTDASGTAILDENSVPNSFTIDLTALTVNYAAQKGVFRTPAILPDAIYLDFELTTPMTTGRQVYIDKAGMGIMRKLYAGGGSILAFAGSVPLLAGDRATVAFTNSRGAGGSLSTWQCMWMRLIYPDVLQLELQLPSSTSPTISDSLITS